MHIAERHHLLASQSWARLFLGCVHYWRNELAEAAVHFGALVERPYGAHLLAAVHAHFGLAMTYMGQGRAADAIEVLEATFAQAEEAGNVALLQHVQAFEAYLALLLGRKATAAAWADQNPDTRPWLPMVFVEIPALTWIRIRIEEGTQASLAQAAAVLAGVRRFVIETHNTVRLIDVLALEGLLHAASGERPAALSLLRQALALAEPGGIVRPFIDLGPDMAALLHDVAKQSSGADYARRLLAVFPDQGYQGAARAALRTSAARLNDRTVDGSRAGRARLAGPASLRQRDRSTSGGFSGYG